MGCDVHMVSVPGRLVLSLRRRGPLMGIGGSMRQLRELAGVAGVATTGPMMARFHADAGPDGEADYEVLIGVLLAAGSPPAAAGDARWCWIPPHRALEAVHHGPHDDMDEAWAVRRACAAGGNTQNGPVAEVYEVTRTDGVPPEQYVTRIRLPIA
jgi:effector-binding domain-containing protein